MKVSQYNWMKTFFYDKKSGYLHPLKIPIYNLKSEFNNANKNQITEER
jgi:hypothetical protein